ncbi:MAG TPA: exosortase/archaeosortase family protein, partial [Candidatus Xenobia bacterium]
MVLATVELLFLTAPRYSHHIGNPWLASVALLLTLSAYLVLLRYVLADRLPGAHYQKGSPVVLAVHLGAVLALAAGVLDFSGTSELAIFDFLLWLPVLALLAGTWLAALVPVGKWKKIFGRHARWVGGTILAGWMSLWMASQTVTSWVHFLTAATWYSAYGLLGAWLDPVADRATFSLGSDRFQAQLTPDCSGWEGMALMGFFVLAYLWIRRQDSTLGQALWMVPGAIFLMWGANLCRIIMLLVMGTNRGPLVAYQVMHAHLGWIVLVTVGAVLVLLAESERFHGPQ